MGNQQLLIVIFVTIVVALASIMALNIFGSNTIKSNRNAVQQDLLAGTNLAQSLYLKHDLFGGAGGDFSKIDESILVSLIIPGILNGGDQWENENGVYKVEDVEPHSLLIRGKPSTGEPDIIALLSFDTDDRYWVVSITEDD